MKREVLNIEDLNASRLGSALLDYRMLNASIEARGTGSILPMPSEDTYVLENAVLLTDGNVLLASDGKPIVYAGVTADSSRSKADIPASPVTYNKGMKLYKGKTYTQGGKNYECFRSSGNKVYADLKDLSIYVKRI